MQLRAVSPKTPQRPSSVHSEKPVGWPKSWQSLLRVFTATLVFFAFSVGSVAARERAGVYSYPTDVLKRVYMDVEAKNLVLRGTAGKGVRVFALLRPVSSVSFLELSLDFVHTWVFPGKVKHADSSFKTKVFRVVENTVEVMPESPGMGNVVVYWDCGGGRTCLSSVVVRVSKARPQRVAPVVVFYSGRLHGPAEVLESYRAAHGGYPDGRVWYAYDGVVYEIDVGYGNVVVGGRRYAVRPVVGGLGYGGAR